MQGSDEAVTGARLGMEEAVTGARLDARLIDTYDGTGDVVEWYTQASLLCEYRGVSVAEVLPLRLKGGAFAVWSQLPAKDRRSVDALRDSLYTAFGMDDYAAHAAFMARTLQPGESVDVYLASLRRYADLFGGTTDRQLAAAFVNGLPAAASDTVRAGARAEKLDLASVLARARAVLGNEPVQAAVAAAHGGQQQQTSGGRRQQRSGGHRQHHSGGQQLQASDGQQLQSRRPPYVRRCWTCGDAGHLMAECPQGSGNAPGATPAPAQSPRQ